MRGHVHTTTGARPRPPGRTRRSARLALAGAAAACLIAPAAPSSAATVVNGDFERGDLSGWQLDSDGDTQTGWQARQATRSTAAAGESPQGLWEAGTELLGASSAVLYQDVALEAGREHALTLTLTYSHEASRFFTPPSLGLDVVNQQFRVDLVDPAAPLRSLAAGDVLANVFETRVPDQAMRDPFDVRVDLGPYAGRTVRLRLAAVQTLFPLSVTVDDVQVQTPGGAPDPRPPAPPPPAGGPDRDRDGVRDAVDNCPSQRNPRQRDLDRDGVGNRCDADIDGDGVRNRRDNCRLVANADQADADRDRRGTACDRIELPWRARQCRGGGWRDFHYGTARFANERDCALFALTWGLIRPASWPRRGAPPPGDPVPPPPPPPPPPNGDA